jgi:opacity protein-like surface antigen
MKMMTRCVFGALGTYSVLAALVAQPVQAAEPKAFFSMDAGVSLLQDIEIKQTGDIALPFSGSAGTITRDVFGVSVPSSITSHTITIDKPKLSLDPGFRVDMIGGYNITDSIAIEVEAGVLYNSFDKISLSGTVDGVPFAVSQKLSDMNLWQVPILLNGVYTFQLDSKFKPFLGAGAGGIFTIVEGNNDSENDFTFAYQGMAGVKYQISESMDIGVTYKFLGTLDHKFADVKTDAIFSHSILAALTVKF